MTTPPEPFEGQIRLRDNRFEMFHRGEWMLEGAIFSRREKLEFFLREKVWWRILFFIKNLPHITCQCYVEREVQDLGDGASIAALMPCVRRRFHRGPCIAEDGKPGD